MANAQSVPPKTLHELCAQEPIHTPGATQPFAALLSGELGDFAVRHCSANLRDFLPFSADKALGRQLADILPDLPANALDFSRDQLSRSLPLPRSSPLLHVSCHTRSGHWFVQLEPASVPSGGSHSSTIDAEALLSLSRQPTLQSLLDNAVGLFRDILGYHRVMIYRFHEDWHGEVVAESVEGSETRYLGLHFPATDIPAQARALYHHERLRIIPDAAAAIVPLISSVQGTQLDLTGCTARAISPVHCEYLRNMGVRATLVLSIIVDNKLWGLVACHHSSPRHTAPLLRASALALTDMLALHISHHVSREHSVLLTTFRHHIIQLGLRLDTRRTTRDIFIDSADELLAPLRAEGIALLSNDGPHISRGLAPAPTTLAALHAWLDAHRPVAEVISISSTPDELRALPGWPAELAGLLAAPVSPSSPGNWLVFFRTEWPREIRWGGDPRETVTLRPNGTLAPRASFAAWIEIKRGHARPWTAAENDYAHQLALTLRNGQLIHERFRAEIDYHRSEARRAAILVALPDMLFVLDDQDTYLDIHLPIGGMPYLPASSLLGRTVAETHPPEVAQRYRLARVILERGESVSIFNYTLDLPDHGTRHYEARLVRCAPGQVLCITRDITCHEQTRLLVERLALVARHTASAVLFTDPERRIVWMNEAFTRISGYTEAEAIGRSPSFLQGPDTSPVTTAAMREALAANRSYRGEILNYSKSGRPYWIDLEIIPLRDGEGRLAGYIGVQVDITKRKATELTLHERDERFAAISRHLPGVFYQYELSADGRGRFIFVSDAAESLWGLPTSRIVGIDHALDAYVHPEDLPHLYAVMRRSAETLRATESTIRYLHPTRGLRHISSTYTPTRGRDGSVIWYGYAWDVTDLVKAQQAVRDNEENLRVILENIPAAILLKDGEGRWLFANRLALAQVDLLDTPWRYHTNQDFAALFPERSALFHAYSTKEEKTWAGGSLVTFEEQSTAADGSLAYTEITQVPLFHPDGSRRALVVIATDITARRTATELIDRERRLFTAGPVAVIIWRPDADMPVEYVSANIDVILGYPAPHLTEPSFRFASLIHPEDLLNVRAEVRKRHLNHDPYFEQSYRLRAADGTYRWIYACCRIEYFLDGNIASIRGYLLDQTQFINARDALRQRNEQISSISAHVPGVLYEFKFLPDGRSCIPYSSEGIRDLCGVLPESLVDDATALFDLVHPDDLQQLKSSISDATTRITDWTGEFRILHPTRGLRWIHGSSSPRKLDDGSYVWNGYMFDITDRKRAEEKLLLEGKREAIERLAGGVAHDFNNYLTTLTLSTDLLLAIPNLDPRVREIASTLSSEIDAARSVARQLLAFSKDQPVHLELLSLDRFLRDCAAFALRGSPMRALVDIPDRSLSVTTDPNLLRQVVFNLILNSRQATREKGSVFLSAESLGDQICIRVGDTGPGIPEHYRSKIFEPYFTTKSSGSGLGLFVARSVIRRLGGDIRLDSCATEGTVFLLTLPGTAAPESSSSMPAPRLPPCDRQDADAPLLPNPEVLARPHRSYQILLLEDEPTQISQLTSFFTAINIPVQSFDNGADFLAQAQRYRALGDAVICLLDITVRGGLGGLDIAADLREALPQARIYLVSGYSDEWQEKQNGLVNLDIGFIAKPYRLRELRARLFEQETPNS
jgi:PAS domain S-box-containing protein